MKDNSPNSLEPIRKVSVAKMSRWPLYALLAVLIMLMAVLIYSVNFAHNQNKDADGTPKVDIKENEKPLLTGEGSGLAQEPPAGAPAIAQPDPPKTEPHSQTPLIVVRGNKDEPTAYQRELENLRRMKAQAQLSALSAPLSIQTASEKSRSVAVEPGQSSEAQGRVRPEPYGVRDSSYDPSADRDKEDFFVRAERDSSWILPHKRTAGQPLELKTGAVIPSVMLTGINSDLPGNIIAQVAQNVRDTATGRHILIPQGAKLFGTYDSRVVYGQERVLVAWNRLVFPDGSAITLGAMPGTDMSGNAGYTDQVNNHYLRIFGSAVLMSMISGGMAYSVDSMSANSGDNDNPSLQQEMGSALASQLGQTTLQLLQRNINIKPTLEIRPGYQFNIVVTKDVVFQKPYAAWR
jgi:type IV secretion system protein VirB10